MIKNNISNVRGCGIGRRISSSQYRESVCNDKYVLVTLSCFGEWSNDIYFDKVEWSRLWEKLQFTLLMTHRVNSCAALECAYYVFDLGDLLGSGKITM